MNDLPSLLQLFLIFFYIGFFTIGGGLVAITLMQQQIVERGWITPDQFYNMVAISESTPGPIGINMATYVGNHFYGIPGGVIATFAEVLPSLICILIIARIILKFKESALVKAAFTTLRPASTGLILVAAVNVITLVLLNKNITIAGCAEGLINIYAINTANCIFYALCVASLFIFKLHPVILIIAGAVFGVIFL